MKPMKTFDQWYKDLMWYAKINKKTDYMPDKEETKQLYMDSYEPYEAMLELLREGE